MNAKPTTTDCSKVESFLSERWVERSGGSSADAAIEGSIDSGWTEKLGEHLSVCSRCRGVADEIQRVDASLERGFHALGGSLGPPTLARIEATIDRLRSSSPGAELIRKVRRPFRLVLWGAFYAFTLVACCALAVAVYRAIIKLP